MTSYLKICATNRKSESIQFFVVTFNSLRKLLTALVQIFSFFLYTGHKTSQQHSSDPCDVIYGQKRKKKCGIL